jgi:hypothetical protein
LSQVLAVLAAMAERVVVQAVVLALQQSDRPSQTLAVVAVVAVLAVAVAARQALAPLASLAQAVGFASVTTC